MKKQKPSLARQTLYVSLALIAVLFFPTLRWRGALSRSMPSVNRGSRSTAAEERSDRQTDAADADADPESGGESGPGGGDAGLGGADQDAASGAETPQETGRPVPVAVPPEARDGAVTIRVLDNGTVKTMTMGDYITGVLRGEMPASFSLEALKAQAVAARTYTRRMTAQGSKHGKKADICTDYRCCQAYIGEDKAKRGWGGQAKAYEEKFRTAVAETDGQVLLYEDAPILAVFHSSSPGLTQDVEDVWGGSLPYLVPVTSPEIESGTDIPNYYSTSEFTLDRFKEKVQAAFPDAQFQGKPSAWLKDDVRNDAGTVESLTVGGVSMRGAKLRSILGLRSACFVWEIEGDSIVFYVTGFGHGVGLSQYGAEQMAKDGENYQEILYHYYPGAVLGSLSGTRPESEESS